ncbi:60S ribosome subunit biogenesis protein NIP7 homolog isoform X2 [Hyaena hyaena]|uniref:60S ribosome subunit biogenesis protein NIP7 homolog isoform X2 n=1 Tax=Hyaena hyaena TaxID=95912 RepID=UPI0019210C44|nr:60S ribosome subunit biogenesis protein NIP7 homolog isoform X2 [Hyaena hyaena]
MVSVAAIFGQQRHFTSRPGRALARNLGPEAAGALFPSLWLRVRPAFFLRRSSRLRGASVGNKLNAAREAGFGVARERLTADFRFRPPRHADLVLQLSGKMRPLTEEETRVMFEKIAKYIGENLQLLVDRPDGTYCFRLHNDRVYYVSEKILKLAANISGDKLVSLGTCFGKFTKTHKFRLHITALDYLAPYAKYKVWIKPGAEQSFLYGNHVLKSGLGRITENTCQYQGVVVYSMADVPLVTVTGSPV